MPYLLALLSKSFNSICLIQTSLFKFLNTPHFAAFVLISFFNSSFSYSLTKAKALASSVCKSFSLLCSISARFASIWLTSSDLTKVFCWSSLSFACWMRSGDSSGPKWFLVGLSSLSFSSALTAFYIIFTFSSICCNIN